MLPPRYRLPTSQIPLVRRQGKRLESEFFRLQYLTKAGVSRFAIVVPATAVRLAVHRSRTKRLMREVLRSYLGNMTNTVDAVIYAKRSLSELGQSEVATRIGTLLQQAHIL